MGIFGWDYPPGCSSVPGDEDEGPCEVCGGFQDFNEKRTERPGYMKCICEECPVCGSYGDRKCYDANGHGMVMLDEQIQHLAMNNKAWEEEQRKEEDDFERMAKEDEEEALRLEEESERMDKLMKCGDEFDPA